MTSRARLESNRDGTTEIIREPLDISTKVIAISAVQFLTAVALAIVTGDVNDPEITAGAAALISAIVGYLTRDKVQL